MTPNTALQAWLPDMPPTTPGAITEIENLLPTSRGYAPDGAAAIGALYNDTAFPDRCWAASLVKGASLTPVMLVTTLNKIYKVVGNTPTDISRSGTAYTAFSVYGNWQFAALGDDIIAASKKNTLQITSNVYTTAFADVTSGPKARTIASQSDFIMLGDTADESGWPYADGWWCSALGDATDWTPDVATQCARGRLTQTPGGIIRVIAYQNDLIFFKETSVIRASYVGAPQIWAFTVLSTNVGLCGISAVTEMNGVLYWCGRDGFYRFDGASIQKIGSAPWRWLTERSYNLLYANYTTAVTDPYRNVVRFFYVEKAVYLPGGHDVALSGGVAYHPETDRWGRFSSTAACAATNHYEFFSGLDYVSLVLSYDVPIIVDLTDAKIKTFRGTPLYSSFTTGDVGDDEQASVLRGVRTRFYMAPTTSSATHYHRMTLDATPTTGDTAVRTDGKYDFTQSARWHRIKFGQTGPYEFGGFSVDASQGGKR